MAREVVPEPVPIDAHPRRLVELDRGEALHLLAGAGFGRVVFTFKALPAIRPVNHLVDGDLVIIRTRSSAKIITMVGKAAETVLAYQADQIDPQTRLGWSVVVTGIGRTITEPESVARYERLLAPWVDRDMDTVIGIRADIVTGFRLVAVT